MHEASPYWLSWFKLLWGQQMCLPLSMRTNVTDPARSVLLNVLD